MDKQRAFPLRWVFLGGLVLIVLIIAAVLVYTFSLRRSPEEPVFYDVPKDYIDTCFESALRQGIYLVSQQGGYLDVPHPSIKSIGIEYPYYFYRDRAHVPELSRIEDEIGRYINENRYSDIPG